jgi:hypothetical protein
VFGFLAKRAPIIPIPAMKLRIENTHAKRAAILNRENMRIQAATKYFLT